MKTINDEQKRNASVLSRSNAGLGPAKGEK